jgi:hypothetical protein
MAAFCLHLIFVPANTAAPFGQLLVAAPSWKLQRYALKNPFNLWLRHNKPPAGAIVSLRRKLRGFSAKR